MESREVVRIVTLRSTIHMHTAADALALRPLVQAARDRELDIFHEGPAGVDLDRLRSVSRTFVEERPRTPKEIREELFVEPTGSSRRSGGWATAPDTRVPGRRRSPCSRSAGSAGRSATRSRRRPYGCSRS